MKVQRLLLPVLAAISLCCYAEESAYVKGVASWRAKNYAQARMYWQKSLSEGGPDEALNNLGYLLYYGYGGFKDRVKAVELWRKASALGISEAQMHLGFAFEEGEVISRNLVMAYAWYKCAIASASRMGNDPAEQSIVEDAKSLLAKVSAKMSKDELLEGDKVASNYVSRYSVRLSLTTP